MRFAPCGFQILTFKNGTVSIERAVQRVRQNGKTKLIIQTPKSEKICARYSTSKRYDGVFEKKLFLVCHKMRIS